MKTTNTSERLGLCTFRDLQEFNKVTYGNINARNFEILEIACRLARYASRITLWVRKEEGGRTGYHLSMLLSWLSALANRLSVSMSEELTRSCKVEGERNQSLQELQDVFSDRYVGVSLQSATLCLAEKILAIVAALEYYVETHQMEFLHEAVKRMAQSVEATCVVASKLEVDLEEEFRTIFSAGCPKCSQVPCACGFRTDKVV